MLSGFEDGTVARWDGRRPGQALASERGHSEPIMCLDVAPPSTSGRAGGPGSFQAASGAADNLICCWALGAGSASRGAAAGDTAAAASGFEAAGGAEGGSAGG